ncbi:Asp-tRNA(Asn)/Glu-tRNA(Gln) amidotransferase subunit GatB, partial [Candidatus Carsonella ruddii]|nr:Asp-tRNA(Asn)/Glu-tRNA(Gln) amidotransferase subunit GatB [Candidatus Carsonella ruddii]
FNNDILNLIFLINLILISRCFYLSIIERKNYFYYDLPKNYQLTQNNFQHLFNLIIKNKCLKNIIIKKIHFEEDAASSKKKKCFYEINYNRSGNSLLEIVTEPVFGNYNCLYYFLKKIKKKFLKYKISNLNMHLGEMRVDLNISILNLFNF